MKQKNMNNNVSGKGGSNVTERIEKDSITMEELMKLITAQNQEFIIHVEPEEADET